MKHIFITVLCVMLLTLPSCKDKKNYHTYIHFINQSDKVVRFGLRFIDMEGLTDM